jgi:hypothetical protein
MIIEDDLKVEDPGGSLHGKVAVGVGPGHSRAHNLLNPKGEVYLAGESEKNSAFD